MKKYSLVAYLVGDDYKEIREMQHIVSNITGSRKSIDAWEPHVTVGDGVWVNESELSQIELELKSFSENQQSFFIEYDGLGGRTDRVGGEGEITTPYALWENVKVNTELKMLVEKLGEITKQYKLWFRMSIPYHPHVTYAFRDLSGEGYEKGKAYLEGIKRPEKFVVSHVALVEKLNDSDEEHMRFEFGS